MEDGKVTNRVFPEEGAYSSVVDERGRQRFYLLLVAMLGIATPVGVVLFEQWLTGQLSGVYPLVCVAAVIVATFFAQRLQARSLAESPEATDKQVEELTNELRESVRGRSYGARRDLIANPLRELDLEMAPRVGLVRDHSLDDPEPISETTDIAAAFASAKRRLLIVGEPGSGKTMAAYALIEHLDKTEGDERVPLLVNLSAWENQDDFEAFLTDYLSSSVGYGVSQPAVARAFVSARRYSLVLDGLDEIPAGLRKQFSKRLDEFVRGLADDVAVVVTCRAQDYEELLATYPERLGLRQAVAVLPLTSRQLDNAFAALGAERDKEWETVLSQRHLTSYELVRHFLSNPLFLYLAVESQLDPRELLDCDEEQELRDLVLETHLERMLADLRQYAPSDVRRYLSWIARFLNRVEVSPFDLETSDSTVFDLANLTPPSPPRRYRLYAGLVVGLVVGLVAGLVAGLVFGLVVGLVVGLGMALNFGLLVVLAADDRSAVRTHLTFVRPWTNQQRHDFLSGLIRGLVVGPVVGLVGGLVLGLVGGPVGGPVVGPVVGLVAGLVFGLVFGLLEPRYVLITSRTPKETRSRSLIAALVFGLVWMLVFGLVMGLVFGLVMGLGMELGMGLGMGLVLGLVVGLVFGLGMGLVFGLDKGGWFVLLQKHAHRCLAREGNLPSRPDDFLEWGIERQIFRRVGGGVRFRHGLIQDHLARTSGAMTE